MLTRRGFTGLFAGLLGATATGRHRLLEALPTDPCNLPGPVRALRPMTEGIVPITDDERRQRLARAQRLMVEQGIDAIVLEPGTSLSYYTDVAWWPSERTFVAVLPARGDLAWVCPGFEEARARELIRFGTDVRVWQEDESPYRVVAGHPERRGDPHGEGRHRGRPAVLHLRRTQERRRRESNS